MIKNGSNTFLIGLAVYWQSCGLKRPITAAGLCSTAIRLYRFTSYETGINVQNYLIT